MADIKKAIAEEIQRLAKKEVKRQLEPIRNTLANLRKQIAELKKAGKPQPKSVAKAAEDEKAVAPNSAKGQSISPKKIRQIRKKQKLSQADFAKLIGASHSAVANWECGRSKPRGKFCTAMLELGHQKKAGAVAKSTVITA